MAGFHGTDCEAQNLIRKEPPVTDQAGNANTRDIETFFDSDFEKLRVWHPEELNAILDHQWRAPLKVDLGGQSEEQAERLKLLCGADNLLLKSYGEIFCHRMPPIELLVMIKEFAKRNLAHADAALPREIALTLYVLSIVVAKTRCGRRIGARPNHVMRANIESVLQQPWLTQPVIELLREGLAAFGGGQDQGEERSVSGTG
jgi:hypothetical protein